MVVVIILTGIVRLIPERALQKLRNGVSSLGKNSIIKVGAFQRTEDDYEKTTPDFGPAFSFPFLQKYQLKYTSKYDNLNMQKNGCI